MSSEDDLQDFLKDVKKFLQDINESKLSTSLKKKRKELLEKSDTFIKDSEEVAVQEDFYDDLPDVEPEKPVKSDSSSNESGSVGKRSALPPPPDSKSTASNEGSEDVISAAEMKEKATWFGMLKKKTGGLIKKTRLSYCGVYNSCLYFYDKESDKRPKECISLKGYDCKVSDKDSNKKEFFFTMSKDGADSYKFFVDAEGTRGEWIAAINRGISQSVMSDEEDGTQDELYTDADNPEEAIDEDLYEDTEKYAGPIVPPKNDAESMPPPPPTEREVTEEVYDDNIAEEDDEIYDDVGGNSDVNTNTVAPAAEEEEVYDENIVPETPKLPPLPSVRPPLPNPRSPPPPPDPRSSPPPAPEPAAPEPVPTDESVYQRMFYCLYNSTSSSPNEMSFSRGEEVEIVEKRYDSEGWWVGKIDSRVGLVPKNYLSPMYKEI